MSETNKALQKAFADFSRWGVEYLREKDNREHELVKAMVAKGKSVKMVVQGRKE